MLNENVINHIVEYVLITEPNEDKQEELYNIIETYVINKSIKIRSKLKYNGGIYCSIDELINMINLKEYKYFVMDHLKDLGIEYYRNELYRVVK